MKDDTISRLAALDALGERPTVWTDDNDYAHGMRNQYDMDRLAIETVPPAQPGWIPVTERLPRPNEEDGNGFYKAYLVQDGRWMDVARWDGEYWIAWGYSTVLLNVVAWMPLPSPWEGGEE